MPPEPLPPWDRFKDKRHDRPPPPDALAQTRARWRDAGYHGGPTRDFDARRPLGPGRQKSYHLFPKESEGGGGYAWSRSGSRAVADDESYRSMSRYNRSGGYNREYRGSFNGGGSKDWRGHNAHHHHNQHYQRHYPQQPWELGLPQQQVDGRAQRPADEDRHAVPEPSRPTPHPPPVSVKSAPAGEQEQSQDQQEKMPNGKDQVGEKDHSLGAISWKRWSRTGSLVGRGSGSLSVSEEPKVEAPPGKTTPLRSVSGEDTSGGTPNGVVHDEETFFRKKQRLGWGEGLAKYEKKKVEGPEDSAGGKELKAVQNTAIASDRSPKVAGLPECTSPATPSSVACSSSSGFEDRSYNKLSNNDNDACHYSPGQAFLNSAEDDLSPEHFELDALANIGNVIFDLVQADDANCGDSNFVKSSAYSKLLLVRSNILKVLEKTEGEIDSSENEVRNLEPKSDTTATSSVGTDSIQVIKPCNQQLLMETAVSTSELCQNEQHSSEILPARTEGNSLPIYEASEGADNKSSLEDCTASDLNIGAREIFLCNKDHAEKLLEVCTGVALDLISKVDIWEAHKHRSYSENRDRVKRNLAILKSRQKIKEKVLCLKFRLLLHFWKEDLRMLALKKSRPKSQKRCETNYRNLHSANQKQKSLVHSRVTSPVGGSTLVPTAEIKELTEKLLSDSQIKICRENLKLPALILDDREKMLLRFISSNGLVEDPVSLEQERAHDNPWTPEEKEIFMEMLATYGKDFAKIASSLCYKTTADCVEFYYKNHKSDSFEKIKKQMGLRKQEQCLTNVYLVASKTKWKKDESAALFDYHGATTGVTMHSRKPLSGAKDYYEFNKFDVEKNTASTDIDVQGTDSEAVAADVLAGIRGGLSSEAMNSCITSSIERREGLHRTKMLRSKAGRLFTSEISANVDEDDICSDDSSEELDSADWTDKEKSAFIVALRTYGKDFLSISSCVGSRSRDQCKIFFSKARKCLGLDDIQTGLEGMPASDANGRCDSDDDACAVEVASAICSSQSCSKMEVELPNTGSEGYGHGVTEHLQSELEVYSQKDEAGGSNLEEADHDLDNPPVGNKQKVVLFNSMSNGEAKTSGEVKHPEISPDVTIDAMITDEVGDHRHELDQKISPVETDLKSFVFLVTNGRNQDNADNDYSGLNTCYKDSSTEIALHSHDVKRSVHTQFPMSDSVCHHEGPVELASSSQNPPDATRQLKENCSKKSDSKVWMPSLDGFEHRPEVMSSLASGEGVNEKQWCFDLDLSQDHLLENRSLNQVDGQVQITRSYPLQLLNMKDANGENIGEPRFVLQSLSNTDLNVHPGEVLVSAYSCKGRKQPLHNLPSSEFSLPKVKDCSDPPRASSTAIIKVNGQICKTGDVRLFGQILSQKKNVETVSGKAFISNLDQSVSMKLPSEEKMVGPSGMSKKTETEASEDKEKFLMTSYGYWDGTRVETSHPQLPDPAILAPTKYTGSPTNYHQVSVYPVTRETLPSGNGAVLDAYNLYRSNYECPNVKSYSVMDMKLQERMLPDLQNHRSGLEATPGYQPGVVGMNVVSGGMLVGRGCTGVSDPVAAIKMHYATATKEKLFGAVSSGVVRDEDSWRGDVGR